MADMLVVEGWAERAERVVAKVVVVVETSEGQAVRARVEVATAVEVMALGAVGTASGE